MFCPQCGTKCEDTDAFCPQCRCALQQQPQAQPPRDPFARSVAQHMYTGTPVAVTLPPRRELAVLLIFWAGHVIALLGWIGAIVIWVKAGQIPDYAGSVTGSVVMAGFTTLLGGHFAQIACFWASEVLRALGTIADRQEVKAQIPVAR